MKKPCHELHTQIDIRLMRGQPVIAWEPGMTLRYKARIEAGWGQHVPHWGRLLSEVYADTGTRTRRSKSRAKARRDLERRIKVAGALYYDPSGQSCYANDWPDTPQGAVDRLRAEAVLRLSAFEALPRSSVWCDTCRDRVEIRWEADKRGRMLRLIECPRGVHMYRDGLPDILYWPSHYAQWRKPGSVRLYIEHARVAREHGQSLAHAAGLAWGPP